MWDAGDTPFGLRDDGWAWWDDSWRTFTNRCAVGTSVMQAVRGLGG